MSDLLIHVSRRAMAGEFEVRFPADRYPHGMDSALESLDLLESIEEELSFFRPTSQISRINLLAADEPVEVSAETFELLRQAMTLYDETQGAYDITATPLWEVWGFARRQGKIPSDAQLDEARSFVGGHRVEFDPERHTIRFKRPGVRINLGSIGKGYALDVCSERLSALGIDDFLFHGGQSSVLARGCQSAGHPWEIGVRCPGQHGRRMGVIRLRDRALGTSSDQFQSFRHQGRRYGHVLDPRTGRPVENIYSTTVVAPTAALADALSTAFHVMGPDLAREYCDRHPGIGMVILTPSSRGNDVDVVSAGLDAEDARWIAN